MAVARPSVRVGMTSSEELDRAEVSRRNRAGIVPLPGEGLRQLQEVMGAAHQTPPLCDLLDPTQQPSLRLFDTGRRRAPLCTCATDIDCDDHPVSASPAWLVLRVPPPGLTTSAGRGVPMLLPTRRDMAKDYETRLSSRKSASELSPHRPIGSPRLPTVFYLIWATIGASGCRLLATAVTRCATIMG